MTCRVDKMFLRKKIANIYTSALPLYYFLKLMGIFPPSFIGSARNGNFSVKIRDKLQFLLAIAFVLFFLYSSLTFASEDFKTSQLLSTAWKIMPACGLLVILITVPYELRVYRKILKLLHLLNEFDVKVNFELMS